MAESEEHPLTTELVQRMLMDGIPFIPEDHVIYVVRGQELYAWFRKRCYSCPLSIGWRGPMMPRNPDDTGKIPYGMAEKHYTGTELEALIRQGKVAPDPADRKFGKHGNSLRKALLVEMEKANKALDETDETQMMDKRFGLSVKSIATATDEAVADKVETAVTPHPDDDPGTFGDPIK